MWEALGHHVHFGSSLKSGCTCCTICFAASSYAQACAIANNLNLTMLRTCALFIAVCCAVHGVAADKLVRRDSTHGAEPVPESTPQELDSLAVKTMIEQNKVAGEDDDDSSLLNQGLAVGGEDDDASGLLSLQETEDRGGAWRTGKGGGGGGRGRGRR